MVLQGEQTESLASHAQRPVAESALPYERRRLAAEGLDDRHVALDRVGIPGLAVFDEVGHQRMQAIDGHEFLREIEWRSEMIRAAVHVIGIAQRPSTLPAALPKNARARRND